MMTPEKAAGTLRMTCQYCRVIGCVGSQARKERHMSEDDHKQEQEAVGEREGRALARSLPAKSASHVSLQGEGSWANLLNWLEISPDALVLVDAAGRIARVNSQTEALFGYTRSELEGAALDALLPERFRAAHALDREQYATSPRTRPMGAGPALYGRRKDGTEFPVDISLSPLLFDGALHVLGAIRDITARRQLEEHERAAREAAEARLGSCNSSWMNYPHACIS
jgi:PAS domain S-box-containing protein